MKKHQIFTIIILLFVLIKGFSQNNDRITGRVYAFNNTPLKNFKLISKNLKKAVFTDSLGIFTIEFSKKDMLVISAAGFQPFNLKLSNKLEDINVKLIYSDNATAYENVIKMGYMSKNKLDYCIENEIGENNNYSNMSSIYEIIQKENPTAKILREGGRAKVILNTRGDVSIEASNDALLVVDGVIVEDISSIRPNQVSSVVVLVGNDASYWGVRGAGGVVEITLKKGVL